jgi:hypothetical protein
MGEVRSKKQEARGKKYELRTTRYEQRILLWFWGKWDKIWSDTSRENSRREYMHICQFLVLSFEFLIIFHRRGREGRRERQY